MENILLSICLISKESLFLCQNEIIFIIAAKQPSFDEIKYISLAFCTHVGTEIEQVPSQLGSLSHKLFGDFKLE